MPSLVQVAPSVGMAFGPNHGISADAIRVAQTQLLADQRLEQSAHVHDPKALVLRALGETARECSQPNWDGYDGVPIEPIVIANVRRILALLPFGFPMPELCPEPDGELGLEWGATAEHSLSLSIGPGTRAAYAWVDGAARGHGVAIVEDHRLPRTLLDLIGVIVGHGRTAVGAA